MQNEADNRKEALAYRNSVLDGMVNGITVYARGNAVLRRHSVGLGIPNANTRRREIVELSAKARARMLFVISSTSIEFNSMITLTYPQEFPLSGLEAKKQLSRFLKGYINRYGGHYYWFLEFQNRGAPHFHILVSRGKIFSADRRWLALYWSECMGLSEKRLYTSLLDYQTKDMYQQCLRVNTHPKTWQEIYSDDGARRYVAKYALKTYQKEVPERLQSVGRFYGYSRSVKAAIKPLDQFSVTADVIRQVLEQEGHKVSEWDFLPKYLFGVNSFAGLTSVL